MVVIAYLSAPGADWFGAPKALSNKVLSSFELTVDSVTCKPTIPFGVFEYLSPALSKVIDPLGTNTKLPLKKNTPSFKLNDAFCPTAFDIRLVQAYPQKERGCY